MPNKKLDININFKVYDQNNVKKWVHSINTIPQDILKENENVKAHTVTLETLQKSLYNVNPSAAPYEQRIRQLEAQMNTVNFSNEVKLLKPNAVDLETRLNSERAALTQVESVIAQYDTAIANLQRRIEFKKLEGRLLGLENSKQTKSAEITALQSDLIAKNNEALSLQRRISSLELNLRQMRPIEDSFNTSMQHDDSGFKSSMQPETHGFNSSSQPDSGFKSSIQQPDSGFRSSVHQQDSGFKSSVQQQDHGFKSSIHPNHAFEDPIRHHHDYDAARRMDNDLRQLRTQETQLKTRIETLKKNITSTQNEVNRINDSIADLKLKQTVSQLFGNDEKWFAPGVDIFQLELELAKKISNKASSDQEKKTRTNTVKRLQSNLIETVTKIENLESKIKAYENQRGDYANIKDLIKLESLLDLELQSKPIQQKKALESQINDEQAAINQINKQIQKLERKLHKLKTNDFKRKMVNEPATVILDLILAIQKALNQFEQDYPAHQSDQVRVALLNLLENLQAIQNIPIYQSTYNDYLRDFAKEQQKVYQLCGLLWAELKELYEEDKNLGQAILPILQKNPIQSECAMTEYDNLQLQRRDISEVNDREKNAYAQARIDFFIRLLPYKTASNTDQKQLYKSGMAILESIVSNVAKKEKNKEQLQPGMLKFYTNLLQTATQWLQLPKDEKLKKRFHYLNEQGHDEISFGQKVLKSLSTGFGLFLDKNMDIEKMAANFEKDFNKVKVFLPVVNPPVQATDDKMADKENANIGPFFSTPKPSAPPLEPNDEVPYERIYQDLSDLKINLM